MAVVEAHSLKKTFRLSVKKAGLSGAVKALFSRRRETFTAVDGIDLKIEAGEIVGFLGPNGAGKTTTLKMLTGILHPTSGEALVLGYAPFDRKHEMLRRIALVMGNKQQLWWDLPARESFAVLAAVYEIPEAHFRRRLDKLVDLMDLGDKLDTQVRRLSLGERMKCELVAAMLHGPEVVFLDEPTIGLDLISQRRIRQFLRDLNREEGCTIMLTSHYMQDVQELCQRVVVIDHGLIKFDGPILQLMSEFGAKRVLHLYFREPVSERRIRELGEPIEREEMEAKLLVESDRVPQITARALELLPIADLSVENVSVETVIHDLFSRGR